MRSFNVAKNYPTESIVRQWFELKDSCTMLQLVTTIGKLPITTRNSFPNCNYISYHHCYNYLKKTWISGIKPCTSSMPRGNLAFIPSTAIWWIFFAVSAPQLKYFFLVHYIYNPIGLRNTSEHLSEEMHGISWNQRRPPCRSSLYDGLPDHSVWVYWIQKSNCLTWLVSVSRSPLNDSKDAFLSIL